MAAKKNKGTVGVIGLGIMGGSFASNLAARGWRVIGFDPSRKAVDAAKRAGVEIADSATAVVEKAQIILTSLPKPAALHATVREIARRNLGHRVIVEMSTFKIAD
jgi:3-hydroxyisobutyrate dehydrogenase-like beta-hydroxyacid dehydrogenase